MKPFADLGKKGFHKLVSMDAQTAAMVKRASCLLGIPETAFIRLALHRAFEQFGEIAFGIIDVSDLRCRGASLNRT